MVTNAALAHQRMTFGVAHRFPLRQKRLSRWFGQVVDGFELAYESIHDGSKTYQQEIQPDQIDKGLILSKSRKAPFKWSKSLSVVSKTAFD